MSQLFIKKEVQIKSLMFGLFVFIQSIGFSQSNIEGTTVSGIIQSEAKTPIDNVKINLHNSEKVVVASSVSNADGTFLMNNVPDGEGMYLIFSKNGYENKKTNYNIKKGDKLSLIVDIKKLNDYEMTQQQNLGTPSTSQNADINSTSDVNKSQGLEEVIVLGNKAKPRTQVNTPVAVDVINANEIKTSGQVDLGQSLSYLAPSFNAVKFGINDKAPFVDPATLRGLGPDQVLVLVNGKRRHKVSFISINDGVGKGQVGTDVNAVPAMSLKRVEILRDGAAAQYGSDAIAGVINMELNDNSSGGQVQVSTGMAMSSPDLSSLKTWVQGSGASARTYDLSNLPSSYNDGKFIDVSANYGFKLSDKGFVNTTVYYNNNEGYDRSGYYAGNFYVSNAATDATSVKNNGIKLDRSVLGSAAIQGGGLFLNSAYRLQPNLKAYLFGGYSIKNVKTGIFTRPPSNLARGNKDLYPNGYNPNAYGLMNDYSVTGGIKGSLGNDWNLDVSLLTSGNMVDYDVDNTSNPSYGVNSPTKFYVGQTYVTQSVFNGDVSKTFNKNEYPNLSVAAGTEIKYETYSVKAGDEKSYLQGPIKKNGTTSVEYGSTGMEGYHIKSAGSWNRTNVGLYTELESDITDWFLLGGALRFENYSDFGSNLSYKANTRIIALKYLTIRGSYSTGFRAPSIVQTNFSHYTNISFFDDGTGYSNPIVPNNSNLAKLLGVETLKAEQSQDMSVGVTSKIGNFTFTADAYEVNVADRIVLSSSVNVSKIKEFTDAGYIGTANVFANAIDTRTRGIELVATYNNLKINQHFSLDFSAAYSYMETAISKNRITSKGFNLADSVTQIFISDGMPRDKFIGSIKLNHKFFAFTYRLSMFGKVKDPTAPLLVTPPVGQNNYQTFSEKFINDVVLGVNILKNLTVNFSVNNLFDVYPDLLQRPQQAGEVIFARRVNQFGSLGRNLSLSLNFKF